MNTREIIENVAAELRSQIGYYASEGSLGKDWANHLADKLESAIAQDVEPVAWLHEVVAGDGEPDQALSFAQDSFPLEGVVGYRSIGCAPLYRSAVAAAPEPVAWLHQVVSDDGKPDQALSFRPDNFPLKGVAGYRSISHAPLFGCAIFAVTDATVQAAYYAWDHCTSSSKLEAMRIALNAAAAASTTPPLYR